MLLRLNEEGEVQDRLVLARLALRVAPRYQSLFCARALIDSSLFDGVTNEARYILGLALHCMSVHIDSDFGPLSLRRYRYTLVRKGRLQAHDC